MTSTGAPRTAGAPAPVVMLLENLSYPEDTRVRNEAEALQRAGHDVTVLAPRAPGQAGREIVEGVAVRRYRLPGSGGTPLGYLLEYAVAHVQLALRLLDELRSGARVVHLHNPPDTLIALGLIARLLGRKVVFDHHDLAPELFEAKFGASAAVRVLRAAQRASFRLADRVIVTNESQREVALRSPGVRPAHVAIVRNGPRIDAASDRGGEARDGALAQPRLVFVGEIAVQDGVLDLVELLTDARLRGAHLTVVGEGPLRPELERRLEAAGTRSRVTFTGRIPHGEVPRLLAAADICLDPAPCNPLNHGSTMIKVAEYLAAGRPLVAYDLVETRRTAGGAALLARCGDAAHFAELVALLAADPDLREELARRGRARAPELVWERSEPALLAVYAGL